MVITNGQLALRKKETILLKLDAISLSNYLQWLK